MNTFPAQFRVKPTLWRDWRWQMENSLAGAEDAVRGLGLTGAAADRCRTVAARYPFRVTPYYLSLADPGNPEDPVLRQCMPAPEELGNTASDGDPFEELRHMPAPRVIHRYRDRLVVMTTGQCAVYCRHCTRKNTLCATAAPHSAKDFDDVVRYIESRPEVREVLVSGGDPLLLDLEVLAHLLGSLHRIGHVEVLRIGTRVPVTLPMRIDKALCSMLASHRPLWINTQFNHPAELTEASIGACDRLLRAGIPVSNQTVLLKGVNDRVETMRNLCTQLQKIMVRPYYVFLCDPVAGTGHFATPARLGMEMERELRNTIGGLAMPRFVADLPGSRGKTPLGEVLEREETIR